MQTQLNSKNISPSAPSLDNPGFDQMAQSLGSALADFSEQSPAIFDMIGDYSMKAWETTAGYVRRHPVRVAVGVGTLGLIAAYMMMKPSVSEPAAPVSRDGRQY